MSICARIVRFLAFPLVLPAYGLHKLAPAHYPARPGVEPTPGPDRFLADDGSPCPYGRPRPFARVAELAALAVEKAPSAEEFFLMAVVFSIVAPQVLRGYREGWAGIVLSAIAELASSSPGGR